MSQHLTYLEAVVTGLIQGVTELFPVSSLGHNVLIPALIGGNWASTLNVSAPNSPYLAFIVGLHVATAIAMIAYFWRDWLRIVRGFFTSLRTRSITTPDERLAWMIILATIPVGIVGAALQHEFIKVFAKPELAAIFLAINGVILLVSERMRRSRDAAGGGGGGTATVVLPAGQAVPSGPVPGPPGRTAWGPGGPAAAPGGPGWGDGPGAAGAPGGQAGGWAPEGRPWPGGPGPEGYSQQPWQQQRQGPDPRYGQDGNPQYPGNGPQGQGGEYGRRPQPPAGQPQYGPGQYGPDPRGGQPGQPDPRGGQPGQPGPGWQQPGADPRGGGYDPRDPRAARDQQRPGGRHAGGHSAGSGGHGGGHAAGGGGHAAGSGGRRPAEGGGAVDEAVAADRRLSTMGYKRAVIVGAAQILALLPGISRDGIVTVAGMGRGLSRQDAVRFSFLLSAPVILAAGALKAKDLTGPVSAGIHGPIIVGSLISGIGAYLSIRFLTKYFSEEKSLSPFGVYCLIAGVGSLAYLVLK
jgi:undecaprenyl pyrophosphate phosphatase UppP